MGTHTTTAIAKATNTQIYGQGGGCARTQTTTNAFNDMRSDLKSNKICITATSGGETYVISMVMLFTTSVFVIVRSGMIVTPSSYITQNK
jgi:hypothetical protein